MGKNKKKLVYLFILVVVVATGMAISAIERNSSVAKKVQTEKVVSGNAMQENIAVDSDSDEVTQVQNPVQALVADLVSEVGTIVGASASSGNSEYQLHKNISATFFWVGEEAGKDNKNISNLPSAWDDDWAKHFGGVDDPDKRSGSLPAKFTPKENPFYVALPYNDFNDKGKHKKDASMLATWAAGKKWGAEESMCKNQWVKIIKNGKVAYAQWEDVGPFGEDDSDYVFGNNAPKSKTNKTAGIDVSPAVHDYLAMEDIDRVDWQFVDAVQVPDGPWKKIITTSQVYWD